MDLASFFAETAAAIEGAKARKFPAFPTSDEGCGNGQIIDNKSISHISHVSHAPKVGGTFFGEKPARTRASVRGGRARGPYVETVGNAGNVGNARRIKGLHFPHSLSKVGNVGKEEALPGAFTHQLALASDPVVQLAFDERAAFLEYECGLSRAEAERQAAAEIIPETTAPTCNDPAPAVGSALKAWSLSFGSLDPNHAPCPDYRGDEWSRVHANALGFLNTFGAQAEALGWETHELFGVHPDVGTGRPDHCGALVLTSGGTVRAITADTIRFDRATYRRAPGQSRGTPIWEVRR